MVRPGLLLAVVAMVLTGCGQKGPLYRPEEDSLAQGAEQRPAPNAPVRESAR